MKTEMEQHIINDNGSYTTIKVRSQTPEDGFVPHKEMYPADIDPRGKWFKGFAKVASFTTNDPRVTRPFVYGVCGIFFVIGVVLLFTGIDGIIMGGCFIAAAVAAFRIGKRDIDAIEKKLKEKMQNQAQQAQKNE